MNVAFSIVRSISFRLVVLTLVFAGTSLAQTPSASKKVSPKPKPSLEKKFLANVLHDQGAIWTAPFHWNKGDAKWLAPIGISSLALIATDRYTSGELAENGENVSRIRISKDVSELGALYTTGAIAGIFYVTGRATNNSRARETGLLSAEALVNGEIVALGLKVASQRPRPPVDDSSGEFFDGGRSFPSGHAMNVWSLATIVAQEYGHKRHLIKVTAYGIATAVSISRYTARKHFLSDVLVGSALGYGIGRYVYHKHHDPALDAAIDNEPSPSNSLLHAKLFPRISPIYAPRSHAYGATLSWSF